MLDFASHEINDWNEAIISFDGAASVAPENRLTSHGEAVRLVTDKIIVPAITGSVKRARLTEHLENTLKQTSATLVCGRAGAGKTTLAADFARNYGRAVAWYTVEAADSDWNVFLNYLIGSLNKHRQNWQEKDLSRFVGAFDTSNVAHITEMVANWLAVAASENPLLIVLDDVHLVFDAPWFQDFFKSLVMSLTPDIELLLLSRCQPPLPLWRMRSKQMLSVIEEELLKFTQDEAIELFANYNLPAPLAASAHRESYGRPGKLGQLAEFFKTEAENRAPV
jgi:LuxR family maltose regulon positive regulatory protein